jgi:3-oxoacyl-[acyl-carrier protein] reductase
MDLGIRGRTAIVNAASKGLGRACAFSLAREGVILTISARGEETLQETAAAIRAETGATVTAVVADVATEAGRAAVLAACPDPDILVNNCGGPKPGSFRDWTRDDWIAALDSNMISAIELIRQTVDAMIARKFGRIVNITSSAVKAPIAPLGLSNGARAGLTGFVAGTARQLAEHNVTINNLLPGAFDTDRIRVPVRAMAQQQGKDEDEVMAGWVSQIPARRLGTPHEFGEACAFLCSAQAGYFVGQNVLIDGGSVNSTI